MFTSLGQLWLTIAVRSDELELPERRATGRLSRIRVQSHMEMDEGMMKGWTWRHGSISTCDTWFQDVFFFRKHHWLHRHKCVKLHLDMPYLIFNCTSKKWKKRLSKRTKEGILWCQPRPGIRHQPHARRHEYTSKIFVSKIFWCNFFHSMPTRDWQQSIAHVANHWLKTVFFSATVSLFCKVSGTIATAPLEPSPAQAFVLFNWAIELHEVPNTMHRMMDICWHLLMFSDWCKLFQMVVMLKSFSSSSMMCIFFTIKSWKLM